MIFQKRIDAFVDKMIAKLILYKGERLLKKGRNWWFMHHIMDPKFDYKPFLNKTNKYYRQFGFNYNTVEQEYYKVLSGIESDLYITQTFSRFFLIPYLNRCDYLQDKNMLHRIVGTRKDQISSNYKIAEDLVYNMAGCFYDVEDNLIDTETAINTILSYENDLILKPTRGSCGGDSILKIKAEEKTRETIIQHIQNLQRDFTFQKVIKQHEDLAKFNETSLNTIRIATYRKPSGKIKPIYSILRFGKKGSIVDNVSSGGYFLAVNLSDGTLKKKAFSFKSIVAPVIDNLPIERVPMFKEILDIVCHLHESIPYLNYLGWDVSLSEDNVPIILEMNAAPDLAVGQMSIGPLLNKEDLDEIMPEIAKWKKGYVALPTINYEKPEYKGYIYHKKREKKGFVIE